jgi:hypothetical protein
LACSMPRRTAARNCASSLTRRKAGFLHELLSVGAVVGGNLGKERFLLGREMDFHTPLG